MACSVFIIKGVKWDVDTDRFLFSPDPHELASWVNEIYRLIGQRFPGSLPSPTPRFRRLRRRNRGVGDGKGVALPG